jgi:hypothetical protein
LIASSFSKCVHAVHAGMHVGEAAAIRYGLKDLGFAPRGEASRLITNGPRRSAMRFPLATRGVLWNRCDFADWRRSATHPTEPITTAIANGNYGALPVARFLNWYGGLDWNV